MPPGNYHGVFGSWILHILPYMEQASLHSRYVNSGGIDAFRNGGIRYGAAQNLPVTTTQLPVFVCSSDTKSAQAGVISGVTFHNYVACYGNTTRGRMSPVGTTSTGLPNSFGGGGVHRSDPQPADGPIQAPRTTVGSRTTAHSSQTVRMAEITDGTSNTLGISETVQGKGGDLRGFGWWGGGAHFETLLTPNSPLPDRTEQSCTPALS